MGCSLRDRVPQMRSTQTSGPPAGSGRSGGENELLGCHFERHPWLRSAVAGWSNQRRFQRLEFLGDKFLDAATSFELRVLHAGELLLIMQVLLIIAWWALYFQRASKSYTKE